MGERHNPFNRFNGFAVMQFTAMNRGVNERRFLRLLLKHYVV